MRGWMVPMLRVLLPTSGAAAMADVADTAISNAKVATSMYDLHATILQYLLVPHLHRLPNRTLPTTCAGPGSASRAVGACSLLRRPQGAMRDSAATLGWPLGGAGSLVCSLVVKKGHV